MRAAFSLLALVVVAAIVLSLARKQAGSLPAAPDRAASAGGAALPAPQAVRQQVQGSIDEAARKAAEAASEATN